MTREQLFPPHLVTSMPLPRSTVTDRMQAHSPGGNQTKLDNLVIHLLLTWEFGSYFVTGFDAKTGESAGLLGRGPHGRPETCFGRLGRPSMVTSRTATNSSVMRLGNR